ncbi:MAG TPA: SDR family NAD(P)-dependent oxidoreductase [Desulfobaccales bacterium]
MMGLRQKTLIITGASLGMGRALALLLAREQGANLVLNARHAGPLEEVAEACRAAGVEASPVAGNARGGGADILHQHFRGYKERGELSSPEAAARRLLEILTQDPRRYQGEIAR